MQKLQNEARQNLLAFNSECMKCILNYCGGSISLHCNFWHVIFDAWTRDIGCVARELDWELVTSKITGLMSPLEEFFHQFICGFW